MGSVCADWSGCLDAVEQADHVAASNSAASRSTPKLSRALQVQSRPFRQEVFAGLGVFQKVALGEPVEGQRVRRRGATG